MLGFNLWIYTTSAITKSENKEDKSNTLVIMNTNDHHRTIQEILNDTDKLMILKKDPTEQHKTKVDNLIQTLLMTIEPSKSIHKQTRHFTPAYLYGNSKVLKKHSRPQIHTDYITSNNAYTQSVQIFKANYLYTCYENMYWPPPTNL